MKNMAACTLAAVLLSGTAMAVDLINKDSQTYAIKVKTGSSTMSASISGGTTKGGICSDACTIIVEDVGEVDAEGDDNVIIEDGDISVD